MMTGDQTALTADERPTRLLISLLSHQRKPLGVLSMQLETADAGGVRRAREVQDCNGSLRQSPSKVHGQNSCS